MKDEIAKRGTGAQLRQPDRPLHLYPSLFIITTDSTQHLTIAVKQTSANLSCRLGDTLKRGQRGSVLANAQYHTLVCFQRSGQSVQRNSVIRNSAGLLRNFFPGIPPELSYGIPFGYCIQEYKGIIETFLGHVCKADRRRNKGKYCLQNVSTLIQEQRYRGIEVYLHTSRRQ